MIFFIILFAVLSILYYAEISPCESNPCFHGTCNELSEELYHCDCTGTFTTGDRCEIGDIEINGPTVLTSEQEYSFRVEAMPDMILSVRVYLQDQNDIKIPTTEAFSVSPNQMTFAAGLKQAGNFSIGISQQGQYDITFLTTTSQDDVVERTSVFPPSFTFPVIVVPAKHAEQTYFDLLRIHDRYLVPSTCKAGRSLYSNILCSGDGRRNAIFSSCGWDRAQTGGIVFAYSEPSKLYFPLSAVGVSVDQDSLDLSLSILSGTDVECFECAELFGLHTLPDEYHLGSTYPYMYGPTAVDMIEFVARDSLAFTFLHTVQQTLLPSWLTIGVPNLNKREPFLESDVLSQVVSKDTIHLVEGCKLIIDREGRYIVLKHNGELAMNLLSRIDPTIEDVLTLSALPLDAAYCFAVSLCDPKPAVLIGFPDIAHHNLSLLTIFSHMKQKGWVLNISSVSVSKSKSIPKSNTTYWNGIIEEYSPPIPAVDVVAHGLLSGTLRRERVSVNMEFSGELRYEYVTETGQVRAGFAQ